MCYNYDKMQLIKLVSIYVNTFSNFLHGSILTDVTYWKESYYISTIINTVNKRSLTQNYRGCFII